MRSLLPSAVTECSDLLAGRDHQAGQRPAAPSSLFWMASEETRPSSGERSARPGPGHRVGQLDDHPAVGVAEAGPDQGSARLEVDEDLRRALPQIQRADLGGGSGRRLDLGLVGGSR